MREHGIDSLVILYGGFAFLFIVLGGMILNSKSPNFPVGYPTVVIGFAFFVFAFNHHTSLISTMKMDEILKILKELQEQLKSK